MDNQNLTQNPSLPDMQNPAVTQATPQVAPAASTSSAPQTENPNTLSPSGEPNKNDNTHTLIAVLLLLFVYPIGLIYMWVATKWPKWVKIVLSLPVLLAIVGIALAVLVAVRSPGIPPTPTSIPSITVTPTPVASAVTTDETANWKTFVSSENSFSIKAPFTWTVSNTQLPIGNVECLYLEGDNSIILTACYRHSKFADSIFSGVQTRSSVKKTEINGYVTYNDKGLVLNDYYILHPDGTFILITPGAKLDGNLFEKVVSTFQFMK